MEKYKEIHIRDFPPTLTFVSLNDEYRRCLFKKAIKLLKSEQKLLDFLNSRSRLYAIKRNHSRLNLYSWIEGRVRDRGSIKNINIPLWVLIEISMIISNKRIKNNGVMCEVEKNIISYSCWGKSNPILKPRFPLLLTPEMISVIFHFAGDGHIGRKGVCSSYRQMNKQALNSFLLKLTNIFGEFDYSKKEFSDGRLNVPKIITHFYNHYFNLPSMNTFDAYIPIPIKNMSREFILAGLLAFIVDEAHVYEVITVYSKNKRLILDIKEISEQLGYLTHSLREKYAYGRFDVYRFSISSKSYRKLWDDIAKLSSKFPQCDLCHKMGALSKRIH